MTSEPLPVTDLGDYRRKMGREVAQRLLDTLEANGLDDETLEEVAEIFRSCGLMGGCA
jgi:hypothetical protein